MRADLAVLAMVAAVLLRGPATSDATFTSSSRNHLSTVSSGDWTPPAVTLTDPGSPLSGTITLSATAADAVSGVARTVFSAAPAGSASWNDLCVVTAGPTTCGVDTTALSDDAYDLRALAIDRAGNQAAVVVANRLVDNQPPTVALADPGWTVRGTVTLTATAVDSGSGLAAVAIQRTLAGTGLWTNVCSGSTAPLACPLDTTVLANDYHDLRVVATDRAGRSAISAVVTDVLVDNVAPVVTLADPGTPLRGTVTLSATPSDAGSGVATVVIQRTPAGTAAWADACTATAAPWSCRFDTTTVATGLYDWRAVATDNAGNSTASTTVRNRVVDNSVASVSMEDPGAYLRGTVTLAASASSPAGVTSVRIQRTASGTSVWTDVCTVAVFPYACTWNSATVADGLYDLRAVLLDGAGTTITSAAVTGRRVDNTPVRGADVQTLNRAGGTAGRIEAGDSLTFTYSKVMYPASILTGWSGATQAVAVRLRDGQLVGGSSTDDTLDVFTTTSLASPVRLGSVNLRGDFVTAGKTSVFTATMTLGSVTVGGNPVSTVTVTVGTLASGTGVRTSGSVAAMIWSPSASATDVAGNACSTAPASEQGSVDKDF